MIHFMEERYKINASVFSSYLASVLFELKSDKNFYKIFIEKYKTY